MGTATGSGAGAKGVSTGTGAGVHGDASGGTGYGVRCTGQSGLSEPLRIDPQASPGTGTEGAIYYDSDDDELYVYSDGAYRPLRTQNRVVLVQTAAETETVNGTAFTNSTYNFDGAADAPVGTVIRVRASGTFTSPSGTNIIQLKWDAAGSSAVTLASFSFASSATQFDLDAEVTIRTVGGSGTCRTRATQVDDNGAASMSAANDTIDTQVDTDLYLEATSINGTNIILQTCVVEFLTPLG